MATQHQKMSDIMKEVAEQLLRDPEGASPEAAHAALFLANLAWNECVGLGTKREAGRGVWRSLEEEKPDLWDELKSKDIDAMVDELVAYKQTHYPDDRRRILACGGTPEGNLRVEWLPPADPGVDSKWEMQLCGMVRTGRDEEAIRFLKTTRHLSEYEAMMEVAETKIRLKMACSRIARNLADGENAVPDQGPSPTFRIGDTVRVKRGVAADVDYPDIPMGGWVGTISATGQDSHRVRWSRETLEQVHPVYRKRCERDGIDIREYWVNAEDLEPAPREPLDMEQPTKIITRPLSMDDQDDRICMVFGLTSDDPLPDGGGAADLTYFQYLKAHLTFPFPAQFRDPIQNRQRDVTVTGLCEDCPVDDGFGVMCRVLDGGEPRPMPLSELEVQWDNPNFEIVDDYLAWFFCSPEAGFEDYWDDDEDDDEDDEEDEEDEEDDEEEEWWNDEEEDWEDEDEIDGDRDGDGEPERDHLEAPSPTRTKFGRNDLCPCGSGKKFKKCCLKKPRGDGILEGGVG